MNQKGLVPIVIILTFVVLIGSGLLISKKLNLPATNYQTKPQIVNNPSSTASATPQQSTTPSASTGTKSPPQVTTKTPTPKTVCHVNIAKSSDTAPSTISLSVGADITVPPNLKDKYITAVQYDYNGDGSWDTSMDSSLQGIITRDYSSSGSYTIKARVQLSDGEITDTCSNSFTLN